MVKACLSVAIAAAIGVIVSYHYNQPFLGIEITNYLIGAVVAIAIIAHHTLLRHTEFQHYQLNIRLSEPKCSKKGYTLYQLTK